MMNRTVQRLPLICIMAIGITMLVPALAKQEGKGAAKETKGKAVKAKGKGPARADEGKEQKRQQKDAEKAKGAEPSAKKHGKKEEAADENDKEKGEGLALGKGKEKGEGLALGKDKEKGEGLALGKEKKDTPDAEDDKDAPESAAVAASGGPNTGWAQGKIAKEQSKHMWRLARIDRLSKLGEETGKKALVERMGVLKEKEQQRHEKAMERLREQKEKGHGQRLGPGTGPGNRDGTGPGNGQDRGPGPGKGHGPGHGKGLHGPGHGQGPGTGPAPGPQGHGAGRNKPDKGGAK